MSKAEELLNSLVEAYVAESDPSSDSHIVIGVDRFITVPDELRRIAVQYDHNMRTVTFDCPRYYDGRDMSKMKVYINIRGPKGARYSYIADNVRVDTSNPIIMHFDWTIRRPITDVNGKLIFLVCIRKADSAGNEENHWNSELNTDLYISEGMEYEEFEEYPYSDIVTQLLQRMDDVEALATPEVMQGYTNAWLEENSDTVLEDIQSKGNEVLNSIPEEYSETYNYAAEGARTKADAIIRTVDGESIAVSDSSDDYIRGLRVLGKTTQVQTTGKNLINNTAETVIIEGITYTINDDGSIVANGTATADSFLTIGSVNYVGGVTYKISGCPINGSDTTYMLYAVYGANLYAFDTGDGFTFTPESDMTKTVSIKIIKGITVTNLLFHPMIRLASITDGTYEPYSGGVASPSPDWPQELRSIENPTVNIYGKNLCNINNAIGVGATSIITVDNDYIVIAPNEQVYGVRLMGDDSYAVLKKGVTYTCSCVYEGTHNNFWGWRFKKADGKWMQMGDSPVYTITPEMDIIAVGFYLGTPHSLASEAKISNVQVEIGDEATEYERYIEPRTMAITRTPPGIPVTSGGNYTDSDGRQWVCDEVDFERGVYVQRVKKTVITGTPEFNETEDCPGRFSWFCLTGEYKNGREACMCNYAAWRAWGIGDGARDYGALSINQIYYSPAKTMTATDVNAKFAQMIAEGNPPVVIGQLETPIETQLSAAELNAFRAIRSNYPNTTVLNDSGVKMELRYNADTQLYIDNKIAEAVAALINNT